MQNEHAEDPGIEIQPPSGGRASDRGHCAHSGWGCLCQRRQELGHIILLPCGLRHGKLATKGERAMPVVLTPQLHRHLDGVKNHLIGLQVDSGAQVLGGARVQNGIAARKSEEGPRRIVPNSALVGDLVVQLLVLGIGVRLPEKLRGGLLAVGLEGGLRGELLAEGVHVRREGSEGVKGVVGVSRTQVAEAVRLIGVVPSSEIASSMREPTVLGQ